MPSSESPNIARFGPFLLDLKAGELHKNGRKIRLQEQTFQVLSVLVLHPGELVTREAVRKTLWPNDTVVEFDNSIHAAVKKLRLALGDSAEKPRYIETVARRGYRLIAPVERVEAPHLGSQVSSQPRTFPGSGLIGKRVSHYRVMEILGSGGMGLVYKAEDIKLGRAVALKFLPEASTGDTGALGRFEREARAASALDHPNICSIYEFGEHEGQPFIAMQFLEGQTVSQRIRAAITQGIALAMDELLDIAIQVTSGLEAAHQKGIIHRDIKPANIFITNRGEVKILDFGLAKLVESGEVEQLGQERASGAAAVALNLTRTGAEMGTAAYMSPEQIRREKLDARTDLFSLGLVLYEMATGRQAFAGDTALAVHDAVLHRQPISVHELNPGLPPGLETIISKALEKDRNLRYQSAAEMGAQLKLDRESIAVPVPQRRIRPLWVAAAVAAICITSVSTWLIGTRSKTPEAALAPVPLTSYPGDENFPTFAPDGNQVAFHWGGPKPEAEGIYVKAIGTDQPVLVAKTDHGFPAWSPDGRVIAFLGPVPSDHCGVFLVPAVGGPVRKLAEIAYQEYPGHFVAWHPNGKWLAAVDKLHPTDSCALFLVSAETGEKRKLTSPPVGSLGDHCPAFSPDGHAVVFVRNSNRNVQGRGLYLLELGDDLRAIGEPKRLTSETEYTADPVWTTDGHSLVFAASVYSSSFLWRLELQSPGWQPGKLSRLAFAGEDATAPAISRQGRLVFVRSPPVDTDIWRLELSGGRRSGKPPVKLISSTRIDDAPAYSPDGKRIAFVSNRLGNYEIWLCDSDGSNARQLTSTGGTNSDSYTTNPRWSRDGRWIYFDSNMSGYKRAYAISADGGRPRPAAESEAGWTSASRNGRWIYFESSRSGESQIWKMPVNGGSAVQVTKHGGSKPFASPDGRFLYYLKSLDVWHDEIRKVPVDGVDETPVVVKSAYTFAAGERGIYFNSPGDDQTLRFLDFSTNKIEKIAKLGNQLGGYSLSPDGRYLLYTVLAPTTGGSDLMLVENFR